MTLFETKGLAIGYSEDKILQKDINISLQQGQIITLMGQNGVGKTTFLKTISKLIPKLNGNVFYKGISLDEINSQDLSTRLSLVLTERPAAGNLTVAELIATGRHPYSNWLGMLTTRDREMIEWAMTETRINYLTDKKLVQLSDGQLQKVMIARALAQETDMIFLDEPTAHLDLHNKIEIMLLLQRIARQGKGILISTHDLQISLQLSDKMWLFNFNEPVTEGIPEDLVLSGAIQKTLFLEEYDYDFITGRFKGEADQHNLKVMLEGDTDSVYWASHALARHGIVIDDSAKTKIKSLNGSWVVSTNSTSLTFDSLQDLIQSLL